MNKNQSQEEAIDILIVEDSETQAHHLAHLLSINGYRVRIAKNGRLGMEQARAAKPTLIVADIAMPEMDGFTLCRQVKKDRHLQDVPVILLTALTSLYDVISGLDCGADNFIRKPFDDKYLLGRIRFILANRQFRDNERVQLGMQVNLGGQTHFVNVERQQIFDLLISTYEEAIQMTEELKVQQNRIARSYQSVQGLYQMAASLNPAITESDVAEKALDRVLDLPGVIGGCISLLGKGGEFRTVAARDFGIEKEAMPACPDCDCYRKLLGGTLVTPEVITDCPILRQATPADSAACAHVSVPLTLGQRKLGVMNLLAAHEPAFAEEDCQVLDTVRNQIAIALERASLYANMESLVNERTQALRVERNLLSAIVNTTGALVFLVDAAGRIMTFNPACEKSLGWTFDEVRGRVFWDIFLAPEDAAAVEAFFRNPDLPNMPDQLQREWISRDGSRRKILWSTTCLKKPDDTVEYFLAAGLDVTELHLAEEKVQYLSNFDSFTGLPNRVLLRDRTKVLQEKVVAGSNVMGFLFIHFARLPVIRGSLGTKAEQALLLQITSRLKEWAAADDSIARLGDASFAVVAVRPTSKDLAAVARKILALLDQPFDVEQQEVHLPACVGITLFPDDSEDFDTLVQGAEAAMRRAMTSKTERYEFYTPELNQRATERFRLENSLRRALERRELLLYYQPQVELKTGKIVGLEALLRWQHPELGLITPDRFIELAEETGLILPIGEWVLREACEQICAWKRGGVPIVPIAVNLSAKQFSNKIPYTVKAILADTGLEPKLLELEMTESLSMEAPENTIGILKTLKAMGVGLSIDDFGTGYSNLNYLKRFPVDKLKLDRSFVREITSDPDDLAISSAVIAMAHSLKLKVLAEGVETEGQLALLAHHGCDEMQGYLFSRPVDAAACTKLLQRGPSLTVEKLRRHSHARTLLVVDDEVNLGSAIRRIARNKGYQLFVTDDPTEAFEILATHDVGVIMCDQRMSGMRGTEFLNRVKQLYPGTVRVVLSGYTDLQSVTDAVNHGAIFKFMTKPWDEKPLLAAINEAFAEFEAKRGPPSALRA